MTKITLKTIAGTRTVIVSEKTPLSQVLADNGIDIGVGQTMLNSNPVPAGMMGLTLEELGAGETCRISNVVKEDGAAKITVNHLAAVLTSDVKLEDWKRIKELDPESLTLYDEDGVEPLFTIDIGDEDASGTVQDFAVTFSGKAGSDGKAAVTMKIDPNVEDVPAAIRKACGEAILKLNAMEAQVPDILADVANKEKEINDCIVQL